MRQRKASWPLVLTGWCLIGSLAGCGGSRSLVAPAILGQPTAVAVLAGQAASLTVTASGSAPLAYQWRKDGAPIPSATGATFALTAARSSDAGSYSVVVSNGAGSATSAEARLTVNEAPTITTQPGSQTVTAGQPVTFSVSAAGTGPLSYQWFKDGTVPLPGTGASLSLGRAALSDAGRYHVLVSGPYGSLASEAAQLTVLPSAPTILVQPQSRAVLPPDAVTFTVAAQANNGGPLAYAWKRNSAAIPGATAASFTVATTEFAANGDAYSVVVSEGGLATESAAAYARAAVPDPTYAGDPRPVPSRPLTVLGSLHADAANFPRGAFRLGYDEALKNPVWTAYAAFPVARPYPNSTADYASDPRLAAPQVGKADYTGIYTGGANYPDSYDRGHQVPRADISYRYGATAGDDATLMSNLIPQVSQLNEQVWQKLEDAIGGTQGGAADGLTAFKGRVWVYTGPVFPQTPAWWNSPATAGLRIAVPVACYKIIVHEVSPRHPEVLALLLPNAWGLPNTPATLARHVTSVARLEALTGLDFFPDLAAVAPGLDVPAWKATVDVRGWRAPFEVGTGPNVHVLQPSYDGTVEAGATVDFQGAATPNAASAATLAGATWTFGDGATATGPASTHVYAGPGTFNAAYTVTDSLGASSTLTRVITVIPPAGQNAPPATLPARLPDLATADGQAVSTSFAVTDDRTPAGQIRVAAASDNALLLPPTGIAVSRIAGAVTLALSPAPGQTGTATLTLTLTDGDGALSTRSFALRVAAASSTVLSEGFESGVKGAYTTGSVNLPSGAWILNDALLGNSTSDAKNGLQSVRMRNGKLTMAFDWPGGASSVALSHARYGSDAPSTWELWASTDGGATWALAGPAVTTSSATLAQAVFPLDIAGRVRFEVRKTAGGTNRFNLDDFQILAR